MPGVDVYGCKHQYFFSETVEEILQQLIRKLTVHFCIATLLVLNSAEMSEGATACLLSVSMFNGRSLSHELCKSNMGWWCFLSSG